jgi:hypothetical protein
VPVCIDIADVILCEGWWGCGYGVLEPVLGRELSIGERGLAAGPLRVVEWLLLEVGDRGRILEPAVLGRLTFAEPSFFPKLSSVPSTSTISSAMSSSLPSLDRAAAAESGDDSSDRSCPAPGSLSRSADVYDRTSRRDPLATAYVLGSGRSEGFQPSSLDDQSDGFRVRVLGGYEDVLGWEWDKLAGSRRRGGGVSKVGGPGRAVFGTWSRANPGGVRTIYTSGTVRGVDENESMAIRTLAYDQTNMSQSSENITRKVTIYDTISSTPLMFIGCCILPSPREPTTPCSRLIIRTQTRPM